MQQLFKQNKVITIPQLFTYLLDNQTTITPLSTLGTHCRSVGMARSS